ncbi:gap junction protein alpha 4 [Oreochromis aureus]|uniref:Gap junction protein n=1 Tax=Oreochromis aureus TaxID=47969 RepID=A0AAZ1XXU3_OREAU|nr:gap junction protein alpha 4 [Oreochromis aureus]XP_039461214.1 gap junction protein alpha 4 [Oreochromis aureus]
MSRADWSFLEHLLEEGQEYSTAIGRVWLTVLFLFRMLVLGTAAESAWDDEQADFVCNTIQPGCTAVCYDKAFPISHFRYFVLQVIFVSTPTIFYFGYVAIRAGKERRQDEEKQAEEGSAGGRKNGEVHTERGDITKKEEPGKEKSGVKGRRLEKSPEVPKLKGRLLGAYAFSILLKVLLEVGFIVGLWFLYDGFFIAPKFECKKNPCPHTVDCFVSRPTEKTIFTIYTQVIAAISLLLNLIELLHLLQLAIAYRLEKRSAQQQDYLPRPEREPVRQKTPELQTEASQAYKVGSHIELPVQSEAARCPNSCESYGDMPIEVNWGTGDAGSDALPSYVNCMGAMRKTHSPRVHYKKHAHHTGKTTKGAHKGHSKQKHYV